MSNLSTEPAAEQARRMQQYYRLQSRIYDATRWSFLFGRRALLRQLPLSRTTRGTLVEVGCGTGYNLGNLAKRFPWARIIGYDVSDHMLRRARRRVRARGARIDLRPEPFGPDSDLAEAPQLILFSYALTMINPQWQELIEVARDRLAPGGYIAVADFHDSPYPWFRQHMGKHHVRLEAHLLPVLRQHFEPVHQRIGRAYGGVWRYLLFVGNRPINVS